MQNSLLIGLSRQVALSRELDVVANNVANMNTTGFKTDGSLFEEYLSPTARSDGIGSDTRVSFVRDRGTWHDMTQGAVQTTGGALDVAIDGKGFLVVNTPAGERYTRNGSLQIGPTGTLMTADGFEVVGGNGPIRLQRTDRNISISAEGTVSAREGNSNADSIRGKLQLVSFTPAEAMRLQKAGGGTFSAPNGITPAPDKNSKVIQGALEKSNVQGVVEITRMIEITRSYTQVAAMLQQQSDMRGNAINKLADVPA